MFQLKRCNKVSARIRAEWEKKIPFSTTRQHVRAGNHLTLNPRYGYLTWPHSSSLFSLFSLTTTYIYNIFLTSIHLELFHYMAMRIKTTLITAADRLFWFGLFWDGKFFQRSRKSLNSSSTAMHTSHVRSHGCGLVTSTWGWLHTMACSARRLHPYWLTLLTPHPCVFCILVMLHKLLSDLQ